MYNYLLIFYFNIMHKLHSSISISEKCFTWYYDINWYKKLSTYLQEESNGWKMFLKIFEKHFLTDLHVLQVREPKRHVFEKFLSVYHSISLSTCDKNIVSALSQERMHGFS